MYPVHSHHTWSILSRSFPVAPLLSIMSLWACGACSSVYVVPMCGFNQPADIPSRIPACICSHSSCEHKYFFKLFEYHWQPFRVPNISPTTRNLKLTKSVRLHKSMYINYFWTSFLIQCIYGACGLTDDCHCNYLVTTTFALHSKHCFSCGCSNYKCFNDKWLLFLEYVEKQEPCGTCICPSLFNFKSTFFL